MELTGPNFIDVYIPHPLGGLLSKWMESNILLQKLYEQKRAFSNVHKLAATVATFVLGTVSQFVSAAFCFVAYIDTPLRRSMTHGRQRNLVLLAFEKSKIKKIDLHEFVLRFGRKHT